MKKEKAFSPAKWIVLGVLFVIVAVVAVLAVITLVCANNFVNPSKTKMTTFPDELGLTYSFEEIKAPNGETLAAWFIPSQTANSEMDAAPSDKTVIFSHDYKGNKDIEEINGMYFARSLCEAGFNVLAFDYSGCGSSTGKGYTFGSREVEELNAVVAYVKENFGSSEISLCGWGFGAAVAIMAGADNADVKYIISDASYTDLKDVFSADVSHLTGLPEFFSPAVEALIPLFSGKALYSDSPVEAAKRASEKSFFFIQGASDDLFPVSSLSALAKAANNGSNTVEQWQVSGANHIYSYKIEEENYIDKTVRFLSGESVSGE